jgi:hypothetical protein
MSQNIRNVGTFCIRLLCGHVPRDTFASHSAFGKSLCTYKRCWKLCQRVSIQTWTRVILFSNTFCRSACEMFLIYAVIAVFNSLYLRGQSRYTAKYHSLSAQRLSERTVRCSLTTRLHHLIQHCWNVEPTAVVPFTVSSYCELTL